MKKLLLIISICFFTLSGFANLAPVDYYLSVNNEKLHCKKINLDKESIRAVLENGKEVEVPASEVKMYCKNGKIFEKLPLYVNNLATDKNVFMQFIGTRAGLRLYKYNGMEEVNSDGKVKVRKIQKYYVFKGYDYWSEVTDKNYQTTMDFFNAN
jgi:hypothetical protein